MKTLLIKNAHVINSDDEFISDILIAEGKIAEIGIGLGIIDGETEIIDAESFVVLPGGIDPHVHMELPVGSFVSSDDFETGSVAALFGGTTTIIDFVTPERNQSLIESLKDRKKQAEKSLCDYAFHMSITCFNEKVEREMKLCVENEGITSFKTYMAYKKMIGIDDLDLISVMAAAKELNALVTIHCENGDIITYLQDNYLKNGNITPMYHALSRPDSVEAEAVNRAITMAKAVGTPIYLVHISSSESMEHIKRAKNSGEKIYCETCPHYLLLDENEYKKDFREAAKYVMSPPLRKKENQIHLWNSLNENIIDTIGTDHCPFNQKDRENGINDFTKIPNGVPGVEHRMNLLYTYGALENWITLKQFVDLSSTRAAKLFGLFPRKGTVQVGSDADLVLWNTNKESVISHTSHHHKCDTSIYENVRIKGEPEIVILGGSIVIRSGVFINHGCGKYLYRKSGIYGAC